MRSFTRFILPAMLLAVAVLPAVADGATLPRDSTAILSGNSGLTTALPTPVADSGIDSGSVSGDGLWTVFTSHSDGLSAEDNDRVVNVYAKNRVTGELILVSRATGATGAPADANCRDSAISADGKFVAFSCLGPLSPEDTNGHRDVYRRGIVSAETQLISRAAGTTGPVGDGDSSSPAINANGSVIAFRSTATNLYPWTPVGTSAQIYTRRTLFQDTTLISRRSIGDDGKVANASADEPSIDDTGSTVAFTTRADNLSPADVNGSLDVYIHDTIDASTELVSRITGVDAPVRNGDSTDPAISGDGHSVAFASFARLNAAADLDEESDIYRRSLTFSATVLTSRPNNGEKGNGESLLPVISGDGSRIAFISAATNFDPDDVDPTSDVYLRDLGTGTVELVSRADGDRGAALNFGVDDVALSRDGSKVVMQFGRGGPPLGGPAGASVVAMRDLTPVPQRTIMLARPPGDTPFANQGGSVNGGSVSADGRFVAFASDAPGLGAPPSGSAVFVRDTVTGSIALASREDGPRGKPMDGSAGQPVISADGSKVAWIDSGSESGVILPLAPPGPVAVYWRDLASGRTKLVSRADGENGIAANADSTQISIDADGSRVAFATTATNLGDGDADAIADIHVRDLDSGRTRLVSRAAGGANSNGSSLAPSISANGNRVAFYSTSTNLGPGDTDQLSDIYIRDIGDGSLRLASLSDGGEKSNGGSYSPSISADGNRVAFLSEASNLGTTGAWTQVYVRDLTAGSLVVASRADGAEGESADASTDIPLISGDGKSVTFGSTAGNLTGDPTGGPGLQEHAFLRNLDRGSTRLVSRASGPRGVLARRGYPVGITRDGGCVTFVGDGELVSPAAGSDYLQLYLRANEPDCGRPVPGDDPDLEDRIAPVLRAVKLTRHRFRVTKRRSSTRRKVGRGTALRFETSEPARLRVTFDRARWGRRVGPKKVCKVVRRRAKGRRCTIHRRRGEIGRSAESGPGKIKINGRVGGRRLQPGRYRLTVTATDVAGNRSRPTIRRVTVVR